jgi:hypothetical protein
MTTTIRYHQPAVGRDAIIGDSSSTKGASRSQIEREGYRLSPATKSDCGQYHVEQRRPYLTHPQRHLKQCIQPPPLPYPQTIPGISRRSHIRQSSLILQPIQGRSRVRRQASSDHCAPPAHHKNACWSARLEATASDEPEYGRVHGGRGPRPGQADRCIPRCDVVTVGDVLVAVYRAVQESDIEHHGNVGTKRGADGRKDWSASRQAELKANANTNTVIGELGEDHWWASLHPCPRESDVWVLRTRRVDYR